MHSARRNIERSVLFMIVSSCRHPSSETAPNTLTHRARLRLTFLCQYSTMPLGKIEN